MTFIFSVLISDFSFEKMENNKTMKSLQKEKICIKWIRHNYHPRGNSTWTDELIKLYIHIKFHSSEFLADKKKVNPYK